MASDTQVAHLIQFGFQEKYAQSLSSDHARELISQLFGIARTYYRGVVPDLRSDVEEALALNRPRLASLADGFVANLVNEMSRLRPEVK